MLTPNLDKMLMPLSYGYYLSENVRQGCREELARLRRENAALLEKARLADDYFARVRDIKYEHRSDYERHWLASYTAATACREEGE